MIQRLGWIPDHPDARDRKYRVPRPREFAPLIDIRAGFPGCYDQGNAGSCTGNSTAGALEFAQIKEKLKFEFTPARLFLYYNGRIPEGTTDQDAGAMIRDVIKGANTYGGCAESDWPYDTSKVTTKPADVAYTDSAFHKALTYARLDVDLNQVKTVLNAGLPVVFGFTVYNSFMSDQVASTGIVPMPNLDTESVQGGHAVCFAGYSDTPWRDPVSGNQLPRGLIVRNSWGVSWGLRGYCIMPFEYVTPDLMDDLWQIDVVN